MRIAPEGKIIIQPLTIMTFLSVGYEMMTNGSFIISIILTTVILFCINFFRDPIRNLPDEKNIIVSPADGKVVKISELNDPIIGDARQVSIFLNVFNVHANRMPIAGTFSDVRYHSGKFLAAFDHKASNENERTEIVITSDAGTIIVKQIAGLIARRILCYAKSGESMDMGDRLGFIRFGSRTDMIIPKTVNLNVELNQKVKGNHTIMGSYQ